MSTPTASLLPEEHEKAVFLMKVEYTMQQIANGHITMDQGYEQLLQLMSQKEIRELIEIKTRQAQTPPLV